MDAQKLLRQAWHKKWDNRTDFTKEERAVLDGYEDGLAAGLGEPEQLLDPKDVTDAVYWKAYTAGYAIGGMDS